ncbi:Anoctamin-5 [Papilio machaon]|uniref:Anoctamin n=1 Tax=Papilio machaon TaxID=76193 RepID=A0A0N0PE47_PAPMA|nr:Anoctamin-5 [Papilio machaon]
MDEWMDNDSAQPKSRATASSKFYIAIARTLEAVDGATPDSNETTVPPKNNPGRTFRDGVRKIDLILVVKDEENLIADPMKNKFLTNIVKTGLEIEFENGVLPIHKKLVFFKVHCPNDVLNNLGNAFGVKCVQIARAEHTMSNKERDWINLIRKEYTQPLQYSSLERSLVVYMTLLNLPFGDRQNYIGLERLMKRNIVVEAYALHDGPYFITQDATSINARQILFYNWVGITNIFTKQPLNVVHEYFGPKVALYFAYYGLYNLFLAIASLAALITLFLAIFFNENYMDLRAPICEGETVDICFQCYDKSQDVVRTVVKTTPYITLTSMEDGGGQKGIFFTAYWFGREKYFNWIWETRNKNFNRNQIRPEFDLNLDTARKSNKTGIVIGIHRGSKIKTLLWYIPVAIFEFQFWRGYKMDDKFLLDETCVLTSCINELAIAFTIVLLLRFVILRKLSRYSRRDAELFTLHYRRPLFLKNKSFSIWSEILKLMVVSLVCSTDTIEAYLREQRKPTGNTLNQYLNLYFHNISKGLIILAVCEQLRGGAAAQRVRCGRATNPPGLRSKYVADAQRFRRVLSAGLRRIVQSLTKWIPTRKHCCWLCYFEDTGDANESIDDFGRIQYQLFNWMRATTLCCFTNE